MSEHRYTSMLIPHGFLVPTVSIGQVMMHALRINLKTANALGVSIS
jgi:hypothetical protein